MGVPIFQSVLRPVLRPFSRLLLGLIAVPVFHFLLRRVLRIQRLDKELEKDLQEWFRASLLLLAATANMEHILFSWLNRVDWLDRADWLTMGLRLLMVIGVIEGMPDQELFAVLHPGPPRLERKNGLIRELFNRKWELIKGHLCRHINRSSPVLAMMCAIVGSQLPMQPVITTKSVAVYSDLVEAKESIRVANKTIGSGRADSLSRSRAAEDLVKATRRVDEAKAKLGSLSVSESEAAADYQAYARELQQYGRNRERWAVGWLCFLVAIVQYLVIGLVTSRDRAVDVLTEFDKAVAQRRRELIEEFSLERQKPPAEEDPEDSQIEPESGPIESSPPA